MTIAVADIQALSTAPNDRVFNEIMQRIFADIDADIAAVAESIETIDLSAKADVTYVDAQLLLKADAAATTTALAGKAALVHAHTLSQLSDIDGDKGDITVSGAGSAWEVDNNAITNAKLRDSSGLSVIGRAGNSGGDPADIVAANDGEVLRRSGTSVGFGTIATAGLANDAVTYAKLQNISATDRLLGRATAGAGDAEEITCTAAGRALLDDASVSEQQATLGIGAVYVGTATLNNNQATSFFIGTDFIAYLIAVASNTTTGVQGLISARAAASANAVAEVVITGYPTRNYYTGALTGSTGASSSMNFSTDSAGNLYLENRTGGVRAFTIYKFR
jgi:hypothetical protein